MRGYLSNLKYQLFQGPGSRHRAARRQLMAGGFAFLAGCFLLLVTFISASGGSLASVFLAFASLDLGLLLLVRGAESLLQPDYQGLAVTLRISAFLLSLGAILLGLATIVIIVTSLAT